MQTDFGNVIAEVAQAFFGEPNKRLSKADDMRFGTHGSMSINLKKGTFYDHEAGLGGGCLDLIKRERGLSNGAAVDWLKAEGFIDGENRAKRRAEAKKPKEKVQPLGKVIATYDYVDEAGELLFQVRRHEGKEFRQWRADGNGGWLAGIKGVRRVPYHLPEVLKAINVFIVEGEKDADRLRAEANVVATCNSGGCGNKDLWTGFAEHFRGRNVYIIPDRDEPGRELCAAIGAALDGVADSVRVIDLPAGKDVSEWFDAGGTAAEFMRLVDTARAWKPAEKAENTRDFDGVYSMSMLRDMAFPPLKFVVPGFLVEGLTIFAGKPKIGKSWWCLDVALAVAGGGYAFGNIKCEQGAVLYAALEDRPRRMKSRAECMRIETWPENLYLAHSWPRLEEGGVDAIAKWIADHPDARLVVIDTLARVKSERGSRQTQYEADYKAVEALQMLAGKTGVAIVIVTHTRKQESEDVNDAVSGTLGLTGCSDTTLVLNRTSRGTTMYVRGRDIEEAEVAVEFEKEYFRWNVRGDAAEVQRSEQRRAILEAIDGAGEPIGPSEIADATGFALGNVRFLLNRMVKAGEVEKVARGKYERR